MLVLVNATPAQLSSGGGTVSGTITYQPGIAQALAAAAYAAGNPGTGSLANAITGQQSEMNDLSTQIADWNPILQEQQTQLQTEYDAMEATLASLKTTQSALAQYFNQSSSSSSSSNSG
jgi:flagellar capping protein FliD